MSQPSHRLFQVLLMVVSLQILNCAHAQNAELVITVSLVDTELRLRPVPKAAFRLQALPQSSQGIQVSTNAEGTAAVVVQAGQYRLASTRPIEFQGKQYSWELDISVAISGTRVELSNDNAIVQAAVARTSSDDDLRAAFQRHKNSVVTVWAEVGPGHGTGFLIDASGLFLTNEHVVTTSEHIAIQIDEKRKLRAVLLAADTEKDVAVLWADISRIPDLMPAPLLGKGDDSAAEGDRVFTIGSPLHQQKILTTGIVSKIEPRAILSDVNINKGNSGGPLFHSSGVVIGITTFGDFSRSGGPGVSGIVRIEEALPLVGEARKKMVVEKRPSGDFLLVEPLDKYPMDAIKASATIEKFKIDPYLFGVGDYEVAFITPILRYRGLSGEVRAAKEKEKRTQKSKDAIRGTYRPLEGLRQWGEYVGEYEPVLLVEARPKLKETFWSSFGRGLAAAGGSYYVGPAKLRFKTDFYRMKLFCGTLEVEPILPGKIPIVLDERSPYVNVTDATFAGLYKYPADAISSNCGQVSLHIFSEKNPNEPKIKTLELKTINAVTADFAPYLKARAASPGANSKND